MDTSVTPRTVDPGLFSDVCPSPSASPESWARLCTQCVGLDRPGGEARREVPRRGSGSPMEGRSLGPAGRPALDPELGRSPGRPGRTPPMLRQDGFSARSVPGDGGGPRAALRTTSALLMYKLGALSDPVHKKLEIPSARTTPPCVPNPLGRGGRQLDPELLGPEGLPEPLPGGLHELGMAHDLPYLLPGEVAAHVVLLERLLQGHVALVHALDEVAHDLLLALGEGRGVRAAEEPLPEGRSFAHIGPQLLRSRSLPVDPILPLFTGVRGRAALRTSAVRGSQKSENRGDRGGVPSDHHAFAVAVDVLGRLVPAASCRVLRLLRGCNAPARRLQRCPLAEHPLLRYADTVGISSACD